MLRMRWPAMLPPPLLPVLLLLLLLCYLYISDCLAVLIDDMIVLCRPELVILLV
jgi:hypothetical protein